jgi:hypothetical protein
MQQQMEINQQLKVKKKRVTIKKLLKKRNKLSKLNFTIH